MIAEAKATSRGLKQSDVGEIPEDWTVAPLGRLISSVEYGSSAKSLAEGRVPVLRMGNIQDGKVVWGDLVFTDDESEIRTYTLNSGDVLFNRTNTIDLVGKTAIYRGERPAIFAGYLIRIAVNTSLLDSRFLNYVLNAEFSRKYSAKVLSVAVGQANINGQKLKTYPIPLPPKKREQDAIAEVLDDTDTLIDSLEQLLSKKRDLQQGAVQELLTGKKRLPGFNDEWQNQPLGECGVVIMGQSPPGSSYNRTGVGSPLINGPTEFTDRHPIKIQWTIQPARFCKTGGLLICVRGSSTGRTNYANDSYAIGRGVAAIRAKDGNDTVYLSYQVICAVSEILAAATGSTFPSVDGASFRRIVIPLPSPAEQVAIATIISDMDAEIAALEVRLSKARQIKQGMMQQLLTGRIRLV